MRGVGLLEHLYPVFWVLFALVMLTQVMPFAIVLFRLLRYEFVEMTFARLDAATPLSPLQEAAVAEITALGFEKAVVYRMDDATDGVVNVIFRHPSQPSFASINLKPGGFLAYPVWFWGFTVEGRILLTGNRQPVTMPMRGVEVFDAYKTTLAEHWQAHQQRVAGATLAAITPEDAYARIAAATSDYPRYNLEQGDFTGKDGRYFFGFRGALRHTINFMRSRGKLNKPYATAVLGDAFRSEFFAETYKVHTDSTKRLRARRSVSAGLLVISGAVSTVAFGLWLGWHVAAAVIIVLLVHECGHALAMRLFGYRDMNMFFIPFMGAAVTGQAKDVAVWKQAIVLLAGPVPGFLFGLWVILNINSFPQDSFIVLLGINAAAINLFNLLPIAFLDGGKLVEITLLARWPYALVVFDLISVAVLAGIMFWLKSYSMVALVLFMGLTLVPLWRLARLRSAMQREGTTGLPALFALAEKIIGKKSFNRQYYLVRGVYEKPMVLPARGREIVFALALFFAVWGAAGFAWLDWSHTRQLQGNFDKIAKNYYRLAKEDGDGGLAAAAAALDPRDPRQIDALVLPALRLPEGERTPALENIIAMKRDGDSYTRSSLVKIYLNYAGWDEKEFTLPQRIAQVEKAIARAEQLAPDLYAATVGARLRLAEMRDRNKETEKAKADLDTLLAKTVNADDCRCVLRDVITSQAWYYIDKGQPEKAVAFLEEPSHAALTGKPNQVSVVYAWSLLEAGKLDKGLAQMEKAAPVYIDEDPYQAENLDLIYAYWKAGKPDKAASLVPLKHLKLYCDPQELEDLLYPGGWERLAVAGKKEALKAVCAALKPASP